MLRSGPIFSHLKKLSGVLPEVTPAAAWRFDGLVGRLYLQPRSTTGPWKTKSWRKVILVYDCLLRMTLLYVLEEV
jgi:hypothetical protein